MQIRHLIAAALALGAAATGAQTLKPGLWEVTNRMQGAAGGQMAQAQAQMAEQMKNMPPEQRKMMEDMMAQRGMRMAPSGAGSGMTMRICMTREMVERNDLPMQSGDCRTTHQQRSGNTMRFAFACTNPPSSGEGQATFASPEAYSTHMTVRSTIDGRADSMTMDGSGRWLGADCGNVKPMAMPKR